MSGVIFLGLRMLLVAVLYLFLGLSLYFLWKDMKQQREILAVKKEPSIGLKIEEQNTHKVFEYNTREILIGRDPACECCLHSEKVSAKHARLSFQNNQWWVEDLNSTNGSYLNNDLIVLPTVVAAGDQLRFGDISVTISVVGSEIN
jgi:pSer/pThr/pTyr-binding forkhead associated (FHA) protein